MFLISLGTQHIPIRMSDEAPRICIASSACGGIAHNPPPRQPNSNLKHAEHPILPLELADCEVH